MDFTAWLDQPSKPLAGSMEELFYASPRAYSSPIGFFLLPQVIYFLYCLPACLPACLPDGESARRCARTGAMRTTPAFFVESDC